MIQASAQRFMMCIFIKHLQSPVSIATHFEHIPLVPPQCIPLTYPGVQFITSEGTAKFTHTASIDPRNRAGEGSFEEEPLAPLFNQMMSTPRGCLLFVYLSIFCRFSCD